MDTEAILATQKQKKKDKAKDKDKDAVAPDSAILARTSGKVEIEDDRVIISYQEEDRREYPVPAATRLLVVEDEEVRAGQQLTEGPINPQDILRIIGKEAVQHYLVGEVQKVYRSQGVNINDKHIETIVRQMMQKVNILDAGDTNFLPGQIVDRFIFREENDTILDMKVLTDAGDSENLKVGQIISSRKLRDENSSLKRKDMKVIKVRNAEPAVSKPTLQGITQASLGTESFISAASFQETTKVLSEASIRGKRDKLSGLKENVIVGHLIPAGTGQREYQDLIVGSQEEYDSLVASKKDFERSRELQENE